MHKIGDVVRLNRGWTPLIVLSVSTTDRVIAKYANSKFNPVVKRDYNEPERAHGTQIRLGKEFTAWDRKPITQGFNYIMSHTPTATTPREYETIHPIPYTIGVYLTKTSIGNIVIETRGGQVKTFKPEELKEVFPITFKVKGINSMYSCHYKIPPNVFIQKGDILVSESNNIYIVEEVDTRFTHSKGVFVGRRLITSEL
jgi:hypothetical protein